MVILPTKYKQMQYTLSSVYAVSVYAVSIYAKFRLRGIFGKVQKNSIYAFLLVIPLFTRFYVGKICAFKDVDL